MDNTIGFINTHYFNEAARFFKKHGRYDDTSTDRGTIINKRAWRGYWQREIDRCINGYSVGGVWITGYHYFYLNYCPILRVQKTTGKLNKKEKAERVKDFPDFWDEDYRYFMCLEIAESGMERSMYDKLPIDLGFHPSFIDYNLAGGHHMIWLKPRGVGASFKGGTLAARNYFLVRDSRSYLLANEKEYLIKDGIFTKALDYLDFINEHTAWSKRSEVKNDRNNMHIRASFKIDGVEQGYKSEIIGVSLKNDYQKARGKRGKVIEFEELGKFPDAEKAWQIARPSVEEGDQVFGLMVGFGTGGTEDRDFTALVKLFDNPIANNCLVFSNTWDAGRIGSQCGLFTPAYRNLAFRDIEGNSQEDIAQEFFNKKRKEAAKSTDPNALARHKAEYPFTPEEATLNVNHNIFPVVELMKQHGNITTKDSNDISLSQLMGVAGKFTRTSKGVEFRPDSSVKPIVDFPHNPKQDLTGGVVRYEAPMKDANGKPIKGLYILCLDPYAHEDSTDGESLGAAYVIKNINQYFKPDDMIVASYVGRPSKIDTFHETVIDLAEHYGAQIGFENDRGEGFISYCKIHKKLHLLAEEFELGFNENIPKSSVRRGYGMHIAGGRDNRRKLDGDKYIQEWLETQRGITEDGEHTYNFNKIYDPALLKELIHYKLDGNFDRVSALRIGMYHMKELFYKQHQIKDKNTETKVSRLLQSAQGWFS